MADWLQRERDTARLVRACYDIYVANQSPSADKLYALCKLTWITRAGSEVADNTASVVTPALTTLTGQHFAARNQKQLAKELPQRRLPRDLVSLASRPVGFTNLYPAFRNVALSWVDKHRRAVEHLFKLVASDGGVAAVRQAYAELGEMSAIASTKASLPAHALLSPVFACLEPQQRAPIINSRATVQARLRHLGLRHASLVQQFDGLRGLIGQAGISDAFALDTADTVNLKRLPLTTPQRAAKNNAKPLSERPDEDIEYLRSTNEVTMRLTHNRMLKSLKTFCDSRSLVAQEGTKSSCLYDALIRNYLGTERHLLIEMKTGCAPAMTRLG